jgi:hypothetical protein
MRKQFAMQTACVSFLTYVCCLSNRTPSRFHFSRKTGLMYMTEILPGTWFTWDVQFKADYFSLRAWSTDHQLERDCSVPSHAEHATFHHSRRGGRRRVCFGHGNR